MKQSLRLKTDDLGIHFPLSLRIGYVDTGDLRSLSTAQLRERLRDLAAFPSAQKIVQRELQRRASKA